MVDDRRVLRESSRALVSWLTLVSSQAGIAKING
jgi:hypothetical protein